MRHVSGMKSECNAGATVEMRMDTLVTPRQFIEAWQTSLTVAEVASRLRMNKSQCRVRACRYRQRGVRLKEFPPVELPVINWKELAQYAADLVEGKENSHGEQTIEPDSNR